MSNTERWTRKQFKLAAGNKAWKHAIIMLKAGKVYPGGAGQGFLVIGRANETIDATGAEKLLDVHLGMEIEIEYWTPGGNFVEADIGSLAYVLDDNTVTLSPGGPIAGRIWAIEVPGRGIGIQKLDGVGLGAGADGGSAVETTLPDFSSNAIAIADNPRTGAIYDVPTTGAASVITLPDNAAEGTVLHFVADGVKNAHTVQYRDGATNLTTALTALKRHLVVAAFLNGIWAANAYVSP